MVGSREKDIMYILSFYNMLNIVNFNCNQYI